MKSSSFHTLAAILALLLVAVSAAQAGVPGTYKGALSPDPPYKQLGGTVKVTLTGPGAVSGTLTLGTTNYPFSAPSNTPNIPAIGSGLYLTHTFDTPGRFVWGEIHNAWGLLVGEYFAYLCTDTPLLYTGNYTFAMTIPTGTPEDGDEDVPQGYSYGAFKVSATGAVTGMFKLADDPSPGGATFAFTGCVGQNGSICIFKKLYNNRGYLSGYLAIHTGTMRLDTSFLTWQKDLIGSGRYFKYGFGPMNMKVFGNKRPSTGLAVPMGLPATVGNARATFTHGMVPTPSTRMDINVANGGNFTIGTTTSATSPLMWPIYVLGAPITAGHAKISAATLKGQFVATFTAGTTDLFKCTVKLKDLSPLPPFPAITRSNAARALIVDDGTSLKAYGYSLLQELPSGSYPSASTTPFHSARVIIQQ